MSKIGDWYRFSSKGKKWCDRKECNPSFKNSLFLVVNVGPAGRIEALPFEPIGNGSYALSAGGALWGGAFIDWPPKDSFYQKTTKPTNFDKASLYFSELGLWTWKMDDEYKQAIKKHLKGRVIGKSVPNTNMITI